MRTLTLLIVLSFSLSAFASPDFFVGKYFSKVGKGEALVEKVLVQQPTLFEPARFEYYVSIYNRKRDVYIEYERLVVSQDGSLSLNTKQECDDPGCTYFYEIVATFKKVRGKAVLDLWYDGFTYVEDGTDVDEEFSESIRYNKI